MSMEEKDTEERRVKGEINGWEKEETKLIKNERKRIQENCTKKCNKS